jgi:hypothetical protein
MQETIKKPRVIISHNNGHKRQILENSHGLQFKGLLWEEKD